jgi:hypothetical protein
MKNIIIGVFLVIGILLVPSCKKDNTSQSTAAPIARAIVPAVDENAAYSFIEKQIAFGKRVPGTPEHAACRDWIIQSMKELGGEVHTQNFKANFLGRSNVECTNIIAKFNPEKQKRILLAAHYDSRAIADKDDDQAVKSLPIDGADDGASGVALLLEIASLIKEHPIDLGVDFIFFDAEDQGEPDGSATGNDWALGSKYWSQNRIPKGYRANWGILLDMVGAKNATFGKEEISKTYASAYLNKVWTLAARMGYSDYFQNFDAGDVMDDHYYVIMYAQIPMIDIINMSPVNRRNFGDHHHTMDDNIEIIDKRTLKVVGQVVTASVYKYSDGTL